MEHKLKVDKEQILEPPPESEDIQFDMALDAICSFELEQL